MRITRRQLRKLIECNLMEGLLDTDDFKPESEKELYDSGNYKEANTSLYNPGRVRQEVIKAKPDVSSVTTMLGTLKNAVPSYPDGDKDQKGIFLLFDGDKQAIERCYDHLLGTFKKYNVLKFQSKDIDFIPDGGSSQVKIINMKNNPTATRAQSGKAVPKISRLSDQAKGSYARVKESVADEIKTSPESVLFVRLSKIYDAGIR